MLDLVDSNYHDIEWNEFLNRVISDYQDYKGNIEFVEIAKRFNKLKYFECFIPKNMDLDEVIMESKNILGDIDYRYLDYFNKMLIEKEDGEPLICFFNSSLSDGNESITIGHQILFFLTNTVFDVSLLLHELSHALINRFEKYSSDKINNEIAPLLIEFIVANKINDYSFLIDRVNHIMFEAKSILFKSAILSGEYDLNVIASKYNISNSDMDKLKDELVVTKNLNYDAEMSYIKGFIYAFYYSSLGYGKSTSDNYVKMIELLSFERHPDLPKLNYDEIIDFLIDDIEMYVNRQKYLCKK